MAENDPRPLTRSELSQFLPNPRAIRAFEKLFSLVPADLISLLEYIENVDTFTSLGSVNKEKSFLTGDYIDFPESGPYVAKERRLQWNADNGTLDIGLYGGSVLQAGQEVMYYAKNESGGDIDNGTPVMFAGAVGASGKLKITLAVADGTYPSDYMMGVATQDIANGEFGYVTHFGLVRGFRTDGSPYGETWNDGDLLYFGPSSPGTWTNVQPTAPSIKIPVAAVVRASHGNSGSIFVRMQRCNTVSGLCDAHITAVANNHFLVYASASNRWENRNTTSVRSALGLGTMALQNVGVSGSFTTADSKTVTVTNGIITNIV